MNFLINISRKINLTKTAIFLLLCLNLVLVFYYFSLKNNFHIDEQWSYGHSNSQNGPYISRDKESWGKWLSGDDYVKYLTVQTEDGFNYGHIYNNLKDDMHTPLYFMAFYTVNYFFPNVFTKWTGAGLNIFLWILTLWAMLKLSQKFFKDKWLAFLPVCFYAFSMLGLSSVLYIRIYLMQTLFAVCLINQFIILLLNKKASFGQLCLIFLYALLGMLTSFNSIVILFFISLASGLYLLYCKYFRLFFKLASTVLLSVISFLILCPYSILLLMKYNPTVYYNQTNIDSVYYINDFIGNIVNGLFSFNINPWSSMQQTEILLFIVLVLGLVYLYFGFSKSNKSDILCLLLIFTIFPVSVYLSYAMPEMYEYATRYRMFLYPFVCIIIFYIFERILHGFDLKQKYIAIFFTVVVLLNSIFANFSKKSPYAFQLSDEDEKIIESIKHKNLVVYAYDNWSFDSASFLYIESNNIYFKFIADYKYFELCNEIPMTMEDFKRGDFLLIYNHYNSKHIYQPNAKTEKIEINDKLSENVIFIKSIMLGNLIYDVYKINVK